MLKQLILYLDPNDTERASWSFVNENGAIIQAKTAGKLSDLTLLAADKAITLILPALDVLLTSIKMPKLNHRRLMQTLPYALEDQLLSEVNELHFAAGDYQADENVPVAVVSKQKMEEYISLLKRYGLTASAFVPAPLALPLSDQNWQVAIVGDTAIARTGLYMGFSCDKNNLATLLELALHEHPEQLAKIQIKNYTNTAFPISINGQNIQEKIFSNTQFIEDIARSIKAPLINLLQDSYRPKHTTAPSKKLWGIAGYVAAAWIGLLFISNFVSYFMLSHQATSLESQINVIYKQNFPQATAMVAPKDRMSQKLNDLLTSGNKNPFLLWLGSVAKSSAQFKDIHIHQMDYRNGQLNLELSAPSFDRLDKYTQSLSQQNLSIKQQNVAASGNEVKGSLIITGVNHS